MAYNLHKARQLCRSIGVFSVGSRNLLESFFGSLSIAAFQDNVCLRYDTNKVSALVDNWNAPYLLFGHQAHDSINVSVCFAGRT